MKLARTMDLARLCRWHGRRLGVVFPVACLAIALGLGITLCSQVLADVITVPNASFEEIYKPGSTTVTADLGGGWTNGVGPDTPMQSGQSASYSDGTSGGTVDIPGWINAPGWDFSYETQGCGSVAKQQTPPDGQYYYLANGSNWGNPEGGAIVSAAPLTTIATGTEYTVSAMANGGVTPLVLELLADGVPLTPSASVDPVMSGTWQEFSRTYDTASLAGVVGQDLTIRLGFGTIDLDPPASGNQGHIDMVSLTSMTVLDPTDFNEDGNSDLIDLDALTGVADLTTGLPVALSDPKYDLTGDDMIDGADLDQWLIDAATVNGLDSPYLKGDANLDGDCDVFAIDGSGDAQILSSNLGTAADAVWSDGDFNGDGDVDVFAIDGSGDAQLLSSNLGSSSDIAAGPITTAAAVPEPSTIAMLAVLGAMAVCVRRRIV